MTLIKVVASYLIYGYNINFDNKFSLGGHLG